MGSHPVTPEHVCTTGRTFCEVCGKLVDRDALKSIGLRAVTPGTKTTVDVHDFGTAEVKEHWNDRVDVTMKPKTIHVKGPLAGAG